MKLALKPSARQARVLSGHPWVFANELQSLPAPEYDGRALPLEDARG